MESLVYPSKDWMKVIVLGVLLILPAMGFLYKFTMVSPFLLLLGFFPLGYLYRILRTFMEGSDELPPFDDGKSLAADGFRVFLILIVYLIPTLLASSLYIVLQGSLDLLITSEFTIWSLLTGSMAGIIIMVLVGLIGVIGMANMALYQGEIGAAFRFGEILERISLIGWKNYVTWYILVLVAGLILISISYLTLMFFIGILLVPLLIIPYYAIFTTRSLCLIFSSSEG